MSVSLTRMLVAVLLVGQILLASRQVSGPSAGPSATVAISYAEAGGVVEALPNSLPAALKGRPSREIEQAWPAWVAQRDREIRARVDRGDQDSLVNLWLYGTSFTRWPRVIERDMRQSPEALPAADLLERRLDDFVAALASPTTDERLLFAKALVQRAGLDAVTKGGRDGLRRYMREGRRRAQVDFEGYAKTVASAVRADADAELPTLATLFRERGLSSDTSILPDFAVDQALEAVASQRIKAPGSVRRVAVIGPGLDFINKADGQDFYPEQSTQPFAIVDSLIRLRLAAEGGVLVTAFDLSPRVVGHLAAARARAQTGVPYTMQMRLNDSERWSRSLTQYWERLGERIGETVAPVRAPANAGAVRLRAVRVRPATVRAVTPQDLNVVLERLQLPEGQRFDLVVATNVLVYYDVFEQALALTNIASMLEPDGVVLSNNLVQSAPPMFAPPFHMELTYSDRQRDHMFLYSRAK